MTNLSREIIEKLPPELYGFSKLAGKAAASLGYGLYLVGGIVRDLLLGLDNLDLDLAVEGNAIELAHKLVEVQPGKITTHPRFGTATIQWGKWNIDLITTRSETYSAPGALPLVKFGSIKNDLFRRDFTINAIAIDLSPECFGQLIDPHGGKHDLKNRLLRVLHDRSFTDDATRILRGLRYKQRLKFEIEPATLQVLQRDIPKLTTISGDRIRHELELILKEKEPEEVLRLADELMVLQQLHPSLSGDSWLADKFERARQISSPSPPPTGLYLALLAYRLNREEQEQLTTRLRLSKASTRILKDASSLVAIMEKLAQPDLSPSRIYRLLHNYSPTAITAAWLAASSLVAEEHLQLYLSRLRYVKSTLTGADLIDLGIPPGPQLKEMLDRLHEARLDGEVKDREGEIEMVRKSS